MDSIYQENAVKRGADMREKAIAMAMKRKEEYLGARVPKVLKARVIKKADEMGIPVSLLMRRLLEQSFPEDSSGSEVVNSLDEVGLVVMQKVPSSLAPKADKFNHIIGWKNIEVNQDRSCERCKEPLPRGSETALGFTSSDAGYVIVCQPCKSQLCES